MSRYFKIIIFLVVLAYFISPLDLIPDGLPILGWIDDTFLIGVLIYYLKTGKLPDFLNFKNSGKANPYSKESFSSRGSYSSPPGDDGKKQAGSQEEKKDDDEKDPYKVLGVSAGASQKEIQAAYRRAVQKYHPDKVAHLGTEFQELAAKKFLNIQEAYNFLYKK